MIKLHIIFFLLLPATHLKKLTKVEQQAVREHKLCRKAESLNIHPLDCCKYPRFYDNPPELLSQCNYNCRMLPYPIFTCQRNCVIEHYGVLTRETQGVVGDNIIYQAFWDQDEIPGARIMTPEWINTVINISIACKTEFPLMPMTANTRNVSKEASWKYYYDNYITCIRKANFLVCNGDQSTDCADLKEMISHCHARDYAFLHKLLYEETYYRNRTEEARLKKLKEAGKPDLYAQTVVFSDEEVETSTRAGENSQEEKESGTET